MKLEPGTVYGKSGDKDESIRLAHLRVEREKERLKAMEQVA
jgi:hypothetical protein